MQYPEQEAQEKNDLKLMVLLLHKDSNSQTRAESEILALCLLRL